MQRDKLKQRAVRYCKRQGSMMAAFVLKMLLRDPGPGCAGSLIQQKAIGLLLAKLAQSILPTITQPCYIYQLP